MQTILSDQMATAERHHEEPLAANRPSPGRTTAPLSMFSKTVGALVAMMLLSALFTILLGPLAEEEPWLWLLADFLLVVSAGLILSIWTRAQAAAYALALEQFQRDGAALSFPVKAPGELRAATDAMVRMRRRTLEIIEEQSKIDIAILQELRARVERLRGRVKDLATPWAEGILGDLGQMDDIIDSGILYHETGVIAGELRVMDLLSLVETVAEEAASAGGDVLITQGHPIYIRGNPVALRRAVSNLIENALRYGRQARLQVCEATVAEGDDEARTEALIRIADSGPGAASKGPGAGI